MKIRRKTNRCLNCGHTLADIYNFCPHCGQENNDSNISFGTLVGDFFSNYLSFDTRIGRSIKPFFLQPGFLTNRFNEGKRTRYVHPLRLYLIASVLFFFVATLLVQQNLADLSLEQNGLVEVAEADTTVAVSKWKTALSLMRSPYLSDEQVRDSLQQLDIVKLQMEVEGDGGRLFHQLRKVANNNLSVFGGYVIQNIPLMMFIVLPLLALVIKLFYVRREPFYVHHLVHMLHLHAFVFLVGGGYLLLVFFFGTTVVPDWVNGLLVLLTMAYSYMSFLRVYRQSWYKTLLKFFLTGNVYLFLILIAVMAEAVISFLIF